MIDTVVIQPGVETGEPSIAGISWPAVSAGAVVSCALTVVLIAFGIGLGLSVISPWSGAGVSATTFKIGTGLYLIVIAMLSSSIGGYIAGRLRTRWMVSIRMKFTFVTPPTASWPGRLPPFLARCCWHRPPAA